MADPTPIEAAAAALRADETKRLGVEKTLTPEPAIRAFWEHMARTALTGALGAVDLVQVLAEARHPHLWSGRFAQLLRRMPKTFPTEELVQESVQKKQDEAIVWARIEAAAVLALFGLALACPVCGSTTPGSSPSCDCDAHRNPTTLEESTRG